MAKESSRLRRTSRHLNAVRVLVLRGDGECIDACDMPDFDSPMSLIKFIAMMHGIDDAIGNFGHDGSYEWSPTHLDFNIPRWQSMETAPLNGTEVLLYVEKRAGVPGGFLVGHWMPGGHCIEDHPPIEAGWYFWSGEMFDKAAKPLYWVALPAIPSE